MMNKQQILRKIGNIIEDLDEQYRYINTADHVSPLDMELFAASADFLNDHIKILGKLSLEGQENIPAQVLEAPMIKAAAGSKATEEVEEIDKNKVSSAASEDKGADEVMPAETEEERPSFDFSFDEEKPAELVFDIAEAPEEELPAEAPEIMVEENENRGMPLPDNAAETDGFIEETSIEAPEQPVRTMELTDKEGLLSAGTPPKDEDVEAKPEKPLTLNEMLSAKFNKKSGAAVGANTAIDLKTSINLNDKMVFIKELFNGYNLAYSEAIEIINRFDTFDSADNFLMNNYAQKNHWADKQVLVDRFYEYINRKFVK